MDKQKVGKGLHGKWKILGKSLLLFIAIVCASACILLFTWSVKDKLSSNMDLEKRLALLESVVDYHVDTVYVEGGWSCWSYSTGWYTDTSYTKWGISMLIRRSAFGRVLDSIWGPIDTMNFNSSELRDAYVKALNEGWIQP